MVFFRIVKILIRSIRWASVAEPEGYDWKHNAIRAVARITNAQALPKETPWALGPKRGLEVLQRDLQFVEADEWVERAVQDVIARSAPGTLTSAKSALRGWAAFADQALGANGRHFSTHFYLLLA